MAENPKVYTPGSGLYDENGDVDDAAVAEFVRALMSKSRIPDVERPSVPDDPEAMAAELARGPLVSDEVREFLRDPSGKLPWDPVELDRRRERADGRVTARMILESLRDR